MGASLRERLAAKTRRRAVVPIELGQLGDEEQRRVVEAQAAILRAIKEGDEGEALRLQSEVEAIQSSVIAKVVFVALAPDEFEKVAAAYPSEEGQDGGLNWKVALPMLAALCAEDEELQDDVWWTEQLDGGEWSQGERLALWRTLLHINTSTPDPYVPKD